MPLHKLLFFPTSSSSIIVKPVIALRPIPALFLAACLYATATFFYESSTLPLFNNNVETSSSSLENEEAIDPAPHSPLQQRSYNPTFVESALPALTRNPLDDPTLQILDFNTTGSPYESRWPDWQLPFWAKKDIPKSQHYRIDGDYGEYYGDDQNRAVIPTSKRTCFVHVGKAAGSTVGCALGFNLHCSRHHRQIANDALSRYTTHTFHADTNDCPDNASYYLFTVRDPLERYLSAYNYEFPKMDDEEDRTSSTFEARMELYMKCPFRTLNDLAEQGLQSNGNASDTCKKRAKRAVLGLEQYGYHHYFNYRYHVNEALTNNHKQVLVIRNPYIAQDWMSAEAILAEGLRLGVEKEEEPHRNFNAERLFPQRNKGESSNDSSKKYLSEASKKILCKHLCQEIQIYKWLLHKALNLNKEQVEESIAELSENCPDGARQDFCALWAWRKQ